MNPTPLRVVIADDDFLVAMVVEDELRAAGVSVVGSARNGLEAVTLAGELRPDVILMDVKMPMMGGVEATREIQRRHPMPVVLLTAHSAGQASALAEEAGAHGFVTKPAVGSQLLEALLAACTRFAEANP